MNMLIVQILLVLAAALQEDTGRDELYTKIKNGDQKAFKTFFNDHHQTLFNFLLKKGVSRDAAEDLIQKAFIYIWEHRAGIKEQKSLRAYLFKIAYTRMLNLFRDNKKFNESAAVADMPGELNDPGDKMEQEELHQLIEQAISSMPEKRQDVFRLCFLQEFTYKEAAEVMEVSVKTIENHMSLALKDLRTELSKTAKDFL